ncbi:MAG TPA: hypothetical protein VIS48_15390 [Candidatus Kryptonia bacterium]
MAMMLEREIPQGGDGNDMTVGSSVLLTRQRAIQDFKLRHYQNEGNPTPG